MLIQKVKQMKEFVRKISVILISILIISAALRFTANVEDAMAQYYYPPAGKGKITVYPDGRVSLSGVVNQTLTGMNQTVHSVVEFSRSREKVKVEGSGSMTIPVEAESQFPFETMDMNSNSQYLNGLYNSSVTMSFRIKQKIASKLNLTDFSANGQISNGVFSGTAAVHLIPGVAPLGQVEIDFSGNQSCIHASGNTTIYYMGDITSERVYEAITYLEANITGRGPYSLYNMTQGAFECTFLNINTLPLTGPDGVFINFETEIISSYGSFFDSSLYLLMAFLSDMIPPYSYYGTIIIPMIAYLTLLPLSIICETATIGSFQAAYSSSTRQFLMSANIIINYDAALEKITSIIEELMYASKIPQEIRLSLPYLKNILQQEYCYVESSTATMHYANRDFNYQGVEYIAGDLNAMMDYAKSEIIKFVEFMVAPVEIWQLNYLNQTKIDITSLKYSYDLTGNQLTIYFENLVLYPPLDNKTATIFQLKRFFNLTYGTPPATGITLTVEGGSNITHHVTITKPYSVPQPSSFSDNKSMTWTNPIISSLQDLTFNIHGDPTTKGFTISDPTSISETNPFVCDATDTASVQILIKQASYPMSVIIKNVTSPPPGGETPPSGYKFLGGYVEIICDQGDITVLATIRFYYTDDQLKEAGIDESSLKVYYWNTTSSQWEEYPSTVNAVENYVEINVTHFSIWALMGQPLTPLWTQPWFIATIAAIIVVIVAVVAVFVIKCRKSKAPEATPPPTPSTESH